MTGNGFVARWGGEEFLFLYDNMDLEEARKKTETLLDQLRNLVIRYEDTDIRITMTVGLAEGSVNTNIPDLLNQADENLYKGKENGRNQVII